MSANVAASWGFLAFTAVSFVATLVWAVRLGLRSQDWLPLTLMGGGALCGFLEPFGDILGATFYPLNTPLLVFELFGRHIPLYVFVGESMFFATAVYYAYRFLVTGVGVARLLIIIVIFSLFDAGMEMTAIHFDVMTYYGDNPTLVLGLPLYVLIQNGALAVVGGWAVLIAIPHLTGKQRLLLALLVPIAFGLQAFIATWPMYLALNTSASRSALLLWGIVVTITNAALPILCIYSRTARQYRSSSSGSPAVPTGRAHSLSR
ncbi:hypothetical protein BKG68_13985 [Mycobacteroides saopaulense]|uniref:Uncharacterized protein n=2 Tax=Mycobacteroides saopaulense TaxID=1578165 RepID=A0ABX3C389_9MYCO|nr:hypothetical protein BKG68_13985 [Mycobacteroides saopaulense]OHU11504.1 hypothetical protein BKG73_07025 [Mycobacteroides saopaulense]